MFEPNPADDAAPDRAGGTAYRVLARKYRPASFVDLIGQEPMVRTLTNAFEIGRIAQAWMLTGVRGVGKTTTARILARALNYETDSIHEPTVHMRALGVHDQAIMEGRHVDVVEMDAASHTGIDDIREIIAQVRYRPVSARYKVYIIDEVHMLSNQAFNGLLKTLEEPPEHVKFVFATTEIRKVPITVLSRCQRFDLRRVDAALLVAHLKRIAAAEGVQIEAEALRLIARAAEGSVRDALSLTDQAIAHGAGRVEAAAVRDMLGLADRARVIDLFEHLMSGDAAAALAELRDQYGGGADPLVVLSDLADFTHLVTAFRFVPDQGEDTTLSPDEAVRGLDLSKRLSVRTLSQVWQMLLKAIEETRLAASPRQAAEMAMIRIAYAADLPAPADLAKALREDVAETTGPAHAAHEPAAGVPRPAIVPAGSRAGSPGEAGASASARGPVGVRLALAPREASAPTQQHPPAIAEKGHDALRPMRTLEDLVALADEKRDSLMKFSLQRYIRLGKLEPGRIELALTEQAPRSLPGDLQRKLLEWTGHRWIVAISSAAGAATLEEAAADRRTALVSAAAADPEVAAVLQLFPGARIVDVRLRGEAAAASAEHDLSGLDIGDRGAFGEAAPADDHNGEDET